MMELRTVKVTRYVTPLREGGSLPAIVEADDDGLYVLKFRGAGQGPKALIAELLGGEIGRALGLKVPELVFVDLNPVLAMTEPDPEIQDLIKASAGLNLALDYLPGSIMYDVSIQQPSDELASKILWFDSFIANMDRTARNANLLIWHKEIWLIDHGAAFYFHHNWETFSSKAANPFPLVKDHILKPIAKNIAHVSEELTASLTTSVLREIVSLIPDEWLDEPESQRAIYLDFLERRLAARDIWTAEGSEMSELRTFDYAVFRFVPRVELEEFFNVGVIVSCPAFEFLDARLSLNEQKMRCFAPDVSLDEANEYLSMIPTICAGVASAGEIARLTQRERFYWLTAQRSTIIQSSPIHTGLTADPQATIERLFGRYVS